MLIQKLDINMKPKQETSKEGRIPGYFLKKYDISETTSRNFVIHHFWDIGWNNPFSEDENGGKQLGVC